VLSYKIREFQHFADMDICVSVTLFFTLGQLLGWAVVFPVWTLLYVLTSPLSKPTPTALQSQNTLIPLHKLKALPYAFTLGFIVLSLAPLATSNISTRQSLLAFWQPFPIVTYLLQQIFQLFTSSSSSSSPSTDTNVNTPLTRLQKRSYLSTLNRTYIFLLIFLSLTHLPALFLTLFPSSSLISSFSPSISSSLKRHYPTISSVYIPHFPSASSHTPKTLAEAVHVFLWWDVYVSTTAGFVWVLSLLRGVGAGVSAGVLGKVVLGALVGGPWGGILALLRERDLKALERGERVE
jgi:hypothetical protein